MQLPLTISGTVVRGKRLGSKLGFPTANLTLAGNEIPVNGVYAVRVTVDGNFYNGVANVGSRPTVTDSPERFLEAYLFGFSGDLYGKTVSVELVAFLREEEKFDSLQKLIDRIEIDKTEAEKILTSCL